MRKILLFLTLAVILVMMIAVSVTGPPMLAVIPLVAATVAHPIIKYVIRMKSPTPKLLCGIPANSVSLLIASVSGLVRSVITIPTIILRAFRTFSFTFNTNNRFLTTQLNI